MAVAASRKTLAEELMDYARGQGFGPGDRLPAIRALSDKLGIGRNAVRDGLLEAQTMGFVKIEPRLGVFLQALNPHSDDEGLTATLDKLLNQDEQNLLHLVESRLLVETELAGEAARNRRPDDLLPLRKALEKVLGKHSERLDYIKADESFHLAVGRVAGNRVLFAFLASLWRMILPAKMNLMLSAENRTQSDLEHCELFQHIVDGKAEKAQKVMRAHIDRGRVLLLDYIRTLPNAGSSKKRQK